MKQNKLKVLMCSEASFINSGFGIYTKELLNRLYDTDKYEIAEFASYGFVNDPRDSSIRWKYYANAVRESDPRYKEYSSRGDHQFGRWRFEKVLLDFRPDVVIDIRDYWMNSYQGLSPLRKHFHWILMPTVDSSPQQEEWIDTFLSADAIFTYSDWGAEVLNKQASGKINYIATASPGVDLSTFRPKSNRHNIRQSLGISPDAIIIGSVMRNQKRKLIPELLLAFKNVLQSLKEAGEDDIAKNIYLYLHTSYPDMGWDIPELLRQSGLANKTLFTYVCKNCGHTTTSVFAGPQKMCKKCLNKAATFPSVTEGVTAETLSDIYNTFDLYVQYSICEGFGMPQVEAGACGVPIATVNYSAMCDVVKKLNAYPIKIQTIFRELETKALRVYPDNNDLANYILSFIKTPTPILEQKRAEVAELTRKYYDWSDIAKVWETYLDSLVAKNFKADWDGGKYIGLSTPKQQYEPSNNFDNLLKICNNDLREPLLIGSYRMLDLLKNADYGFTHSGPTSISSFSFNNIHDYLSGITNNNNQAQEAKDKNIHFDEDFINYAHLKNKTQ